MRTLIRGPVVWVVLAVILAAATLGVFGTRLASSKADDAGIPLDTVKRGPLTISVTVSGTIRSRQQEVIKSEVEGTATILYLIPEGTRVQKGDLLVELDTSKLEDSKVSQQIVVQNAEAAFISAREALEVARSQAQSDIAQAELNYQFAKEDRAKYDKDFEILKMESDNKIKLAEEELALNTRKAASSEKLWKENYVSEMEKEQDKLAMQRSTLSLQLAKLTNDVLLSYTKQREITKLDAAIEQARMALDRVKRKAAADIVQAEASLRAKESELARQKDLLDKTLRMIEKARITAPTDGLVVYATTGGGGGFRGDREPLAEGQTVRERQEIIHLPTADSVMAIVKVHESSLDKVQVGLPVRVMVDAVPNKVYTGHVAKIAPLPDPQSFWQNPDLKVYNTDIWIDGDGSALRTGMTCRAEIIVDHYPDALYIPVHAVVRVAGKPTVYVPGPDGLVPTPVEIGLDNNRMIRIISGLEEGQQIALAPPLADAAVGTEQGQGGPSAESLLKSATRPAGFGAPDATPRAPARASLGPDGAEAGTGERPRGQGRRGPDLSTMTDQQRAAFEERRRQFENMTPEQRQQAMEQFRQGRRGRTPTTRPTPTDQP